jgi:hypothetical protein
MHKGYAFVQFTNPFDARNACHGEDGRTILSQVLGEPNLCMYYNFKFNHNCFDML